jgi:hypothetical protein
VTDYSYLQYRLRLVIGSSQVAGDLVCVLLGCNSPLLLRKNKQNEFHVVGTVYMHGLMYGEALLGHVPAPWKPRSFQTDINHRRLQFYNTLTEESTFEDPRLPPLPSGWRLVQDIDYSHHRRKFENTETGEFTYHDPRLTNSALTERGVKLETFTLV